MCRVQVESSLAGGTPQQLSSVEHLICNQKVEGSNPSGGTIPTTCIKPEPKVYTGTEIIGIGQMHKSNAVPIRRKQDAKDLANMRR